MAKTKEELNAIKEDVETLNEKLKELTEEELAQVTGGVGDSNFDLTDEMIASGQYFVGQRDRITYNKVIYLNLNTKVLINQIPMYIYEATSGERLYIPFDNYS